MTDGDKQISVAELLARNGGQQVGNVSGGRRRRGGKGAVSVASLTGEIPVISDDPEPDVGAAQNSQPQAVESPQPREPAVLAPLPQDEPTKAGELPQRHHQPVEPPPRRTRAERRAAEAAAARSAEPPPAPSVGFGGFDLSSFGLDGLSGANGNATPNGAGAHSDDNAHGGAHSNGGDPARGNDSRDMPGHGDGTTLEPPMGEAKPSFASLLDFPDFPGAGAGTEPTERPTPQFPAGPDSKPLFDLQSLPASPSVAPTSDPPSRPVPQASDKATKPPLPRRNSLLSAFGSRASRDEAPTEIHVPDAPDELSDRTLRPEPDDGMDATAAWPVPPRPGAAARSASVDEDLSRPAQAAGPANPGSEPVKRVAGGVPDQHPGAAQPGSGPGPRPALEDFPTAVWTMSSQEPQLLSGATLAGELMRNTPDGGSALDRGPRPDSPPPERGPKSTDRPARVPEPDDEPTDVNHPFFAHHDDDDEIDDEIPDEEDQAAIKRQWWILGGQWVGAGIAGVALFKGFELLWGILPWVALALAVAVILGLVALVRVLRRGDDVLSLAIAVVVGVFVTLGPLAFILHTG